MIKVILFCAGFLLIIFLFSEECVRALDWLRATLKRHPGYRIIVYPLLLALVVAAGIIIAKSLINFATGITFSYD